MEQLLLPLVPHPTMSLEKAAAIIREYLEEPAKLLELPLWDWRKDEWRGLVSVTPWGPLVIATFRFRRVDAQAA